MVPMALMARQVRSLMAIFCPERQVLRGEMVQGEAGAVAAEEEEGASDIIV